MGRAGQSRGGHGRKSVSFAQELDPVPIAPLAV